MGKQHIDAKHEQICLEYLLTASILSDQVGFPAGDIVES